MKIQERTRVIQHASGKKMERHENKRQDARLAFKRGMKLKESSIRKNCARKIWEWGRGGKMSREFTATPLKFGDKAVRSDQCLGCKREIN